MNFVIYTADCTGNKANCDYPHRVEVDSLQKGKALILHLFVTCFQVQIILLQMGKHITK